MNAGGFFGAIDAYVMAPAPKERLAAVRVLCGGFAMAYVLARLPHLLSYAHFAADQFRPVGVVALVLEAPLLPWVVMVVTGATAVLSIPFFLGWRFRLLGPLFAAALLWTLTYRHSWGMVFHTDNLLILHVMILALSRSADAWSLDGKKSDSSPRGPCEHGRYGWPLRTMAWVVVIAYVLAGVAKLSGGGTSWLWGDELRNYVAIDNARKVLLGDWYSAIAPPLLHCDGLFKILAFLTVAIELGAPLALLGVRAAAVWAALAVGFHLGVLALMMIAFPYQMLGVSFACFFPAERLLDWLNRQARSRLRRWRGQQKGRRHRAGPPPD